MSLRGKSSEFIPDTYVDKMHVVAYLFIISILLNVILRRY